MIEEMKIKYDCHEAYKEENCECKKYRKTCLGVVIAILATLFVGIVGVIIGAALSGIILGALAAVIVLAVVLLILLVLSIILALCCKCKDRKNCHKNCCCYR